jgi:hypothetical protein
MTTLHYGNMRLRTYLAEGQTDPPATRHELSVDAVAPAGCNPVLPAVARVAAEDQ